MENAKICAVIVTWNRKVYLKKLLDALMRQTVMLSGIYILDNCSEDGTEQMLLDIGFIDKTDFNTENFKIWNLCKCFYFRNLVNSGGAGGFKTCFQNAMKYDWDYLWVMDDDVLPEKDCLEKLIKNIDEDAQICIPSRTDENYEDMACIEYDLTSPFLLRYRKKRKLLKNTEINNEWIFVYFMPFEGPLISTKVIDLIGYPDDSYFIFYDDSDYAYRANKITKIKYVKTAVLHKQIIPTSGNFSWRDYYGMRNNFVFDRRYGKNWLVRNLRPWLTSIAFLIYYRLNNKPYEYKITKKAYADAKKGIMGKVILPEK